MGLEILENLDNLDIVTTQKLSGMEKLLSYKPNNDKFSQFHKSNSKVRLLAGGRRSGKTVSGIVEICWAALGVHPFLDYPSPPLSIRICSVDFASGKQIVLPTLYEWLPRFSINKYWAEDRILELKNGTVMDIKSYDQDVEKFEGVARHICFMDEEPTREIYESNYLRTIAKGINGKLIITMTPLHGMDWVYSTLYDNPEAVPPYVEHWHVSTYENPHLDPDAIKAIEKDPVVKDNLEAAIYGKFISHTGLIYPQFDYYKHVIQPIKEIPSDWLVVLGIDPSGGRNEHGVVFCGLTPQNTWIIFDEIHEYCIISELVNKIKAKLGKRFPPNLAIMDTAGNAPQSISGKSIAEEFTQNYGLYTIPAYKDITAGRLKINEMLDPGAGKKPELYVTQNCVSLIRQFRHYQWDNYVGRRRDKLDPKERPMKRDDDLCDCYDQETEILTFDGWKLFKDINAEREIVATLNKETWELEYQQITGYVEKNCNGKMLFCDGVTTEFCVTPTHRLYSSRQYNYKVAKNFKFELGTFDMFGVEFPIKKDALWEGKDQSVFYLPKIDGNANCKQFFEIDMNNWLEFLGVYLAEGYAEKSHNRVMIAQSPSSKQFETIKQILGRLPFNFKCYEKAIIFYCMNKQLYEYVSKLGKSSQKYIPREYLQLSSGHLNHLLFGMMLGDGTIDSLGNYVKYDSTSKQLIDDVQELCLKTGRYGNVHTYLHPAMISPTNGKLYTNCKPTWRINFSSGRGYTTVTVKRNIKEIDYDGNIYCVEVPNQIIYTRRNGKAMWGGNSLRYAVMANIIYRHPSFSQVYKQKLPENISKTGYY